MQMLFDDTYKTIGAQSEGVYKDRGSKFIAIALPVISEDEVKQQLSEIRSAYHDARHHCYAYVLGAGKDAHRFNDDGEPSGTAGRPIFGQISSNDLTNILVVVVRYFGGDCVVHRYRLEHLFCAVPRAAFPARHLDFSLQRLAHSPVSRAVLV